MKKTLLLTTTAFLTWSSAAHAAEPASMEQMQRQIEMLARQVEKLSQVVEEQGKVISSQKEQLHSQGARIQEQAERVDSQSKSIDTLAAAAPAAKDSVDAVKITMKPSPRIESADGRYSFQPMGRVHLDVTQFIDDKRDHPSNAHFRRARLGAKGDLGEDFNYRVEFDLGGEASNLKETYLAYTGLEPVEFQLGNFKPGLGLEQNTSSNYMEFMELSPASNAFTRDEIIGVAVKTGGENWSLTSGVFNEDAGVNTSDDESWSVDARGSVDFLQDSPDVLHAGLGASYRSPNATTDSVTISGKPAGTGSNMVTTGAIANASNSIVLGAELAGVFGPFSMQGEYFYNEIDRESGSDPSFDGWYAQASYFLTGETRPYKGKTGNFDRVKPSSPFSLKNGGTGAWEILARYDNLDLNDPDAGITGGDMSNWTGGINWYLTDYTRMMLNYMQVDTDDNAVVADDDPKVIGLRTQWDF